jgi:hypothetical protein
MASLAASLLSFDSFSLEDLRVSFLFPSARTPLLWQKRMPV